MILKLHAEKILLFNSSVVTQKTRCLDKEVWLRGFLLITGAFDLNSSYSNYCNKMLGWSDSDICLVNLIPQSTEWKIYKCLVFKLYKNFKAIALKKEKS